MKFIAFEGLDGSGKSTLIEALKTELETKGHQVVVSREPGGTSLGEDIRHLLLRTDGEAPVPRAEILLYEAARAQHVDQLIQPALQSDKWVLCDRYSASSVAFQASGRNLLREEIDWLNRFATGDVKPDLWVLLDLSSEEAARRMAHRDLDRFEREDRTFHERVRSGYLALSREKNSGEWLVLDASQPPEVLRRRLFDHLRERGWW